MNIIAFLIIILIILYLFAISINTKVEGLDLTYGTFCESCETKSYGDCMRCFNCGFCESETDKKTGAYKGQCMKGDLTGPYDRSVKCNKWYVNDPFWSNAATENQCIIPAFST